MVTYEETTGMTTEHKYIYVFYAVLCFMENPAFEFSFQSISHWEK